MGVVRITTHRFIAIEGIDCVGKSTISQLFARRIKARWVKTPMDPLAQLRTVYDNQPNYLARYLYYLSTVAYASELIERILENDDVVCDRYIASTLAYHQALGVNITTFDLDCSGIITPNLTICLMVPEQTRQKWFTKRSIQTDNMALHPVLDDESFLARVSKVLVEHSDIVIDTSRHSPEGVVDEIISFL